MTQGQLVSTTPADRLAEAWWKQRHEQCVSLTQKGGIDVVFLGDSITQGWEGPGKPAWDATFAPLKAANFGFSGDRTEHVLWRLANGEIIGLRPKLVVLMIGTNNLGHGSSDVDPTAEGVKAIVAKLRNESPDTKILLLGIFPRDIQPTNPLRIKVGSVTEKFKGCADEKSVHFMDIGKFFLRGDGTLRTYLMPDNLHLNAAGYEIWAKAISPKVRELVGAPPVTWTWGVK